jgi:hypothetical protein
MRKYYVSLTRDLFNVYLAFEATSERAVHQHLEREYLVNGVWKLPWCAVYETLPPAHGSVPQIVVNAVCEPLTEEE